MILYLQSFAFFSRYCNVTDDLSSLCMDELRSFSLVPAIGSKAEVLLTTNTVSGMRLNSCMHRISFSSALNGWQAILANSLDLSYVTDNALRLVAQMMVGWVFRLFVLSVPTGFACCDASRLINRSCEESSTLLVLPIGSSARLGCDHVSTEERCS